MTRVRGSTPCIYKEFHHEGQATGIRLFFVKKEQGAGCRSPFQNLEIYLGSVSSQKCVCCFLAASRDELLARTCLRRWYPNSLAKEYSGA